MKDFSNVSIEFLPPMQVACYRAYSPTSEQEARQYLETWLACQGVKSPLRQFGFDINIQKNQRSAGLRGYEL